MFRVILNTSSRYVPVFPFFALYNIRLPSFTRNYSPL
jgi:hypothetical protein